MNTLDYILDKFNLEKVEGRSKSLEIAGKREEILPMIFNALNMKKGAEIGVERGVFSKQLCDAVPNLTLFGIDPWMAYKGYREHVSQDKLEGFYELTVEKMKPYDFRIFRAFSEEAYKYFRDGSLDFVYIDGNHSFLNATQDIAFWSPKVRKGGIIAGHDYRRNSGKYINDVKDVVPAYAYAGRINPWFIIREPVGASSWFWIQED